MVGYHGPVRSANSFQLRLCALKVRCPSLTRLIKPTDLICRSAGNGNYGQNIGAGFTPSQIAFMLTNAMYNSEITKFPGPYGSDNVDTSNFGGWGHFSQIVWADTTAVGCATQYCPNGLVNAGPNTPPYFTVCNYFPAGKWRYASYC